MAALSFARQPKYHNRKTVVDGITFDSAKEARRWSELRLLERAGKITALSRQVTFPLTVNGKLICSYRADFVFSDETGQRVIEDAKGFRTPEYKLKAKLMAALHGEVKEV